MYGFVVTTAGEGLLARAAGGETLTITGTRVGSGSVAGESAARALTALIQDQAAGTYSTPEVSGGQLSMVVEYRNNLNGGLQAGFTLREFGVFARVGDDAPTLMYYAALGDRAPEVPPITEGLDVHRWPVAVAVSGELAVTVEDPSGAFVDDSKLQKYLPLAGGTMTGPLALDALQVGTKGKGVVVGLDSAGTLETPVVQVASQYGSGPAVLRGVAQAQQSGDALPKGQADGAYLPKSQKGQPDGVASLDGEGKVPGEQLPEMNYVQNITRTAAVAAGQSIQAGDVVDLNDDGQVVATLERLPPNFNYSADNIPSSDGVIVPIESGEYGSYFVLNSAASGGAKPRGSVLGDSGEFKASGLEATQSTVPAGATEFFAFPGDADRIAVIYVNSDGHFCMSGLSKGAGAGWSTATVMTDYRMDYYTIVSAAYVQLDDVTLCIGCHNNASSYYLVTEFAWWDEGRTHADGSETDLEGRADYIAASLLSSAPASGGTEYRILIVYGGNAYSGVRARVCTVTIPASGAKSAVMGAETAPGLEDMSGAKLLTLDGGTALILYKPKGTGSCRMALLAVSGDAVSAASDPVNVSTAASTANITLSGTADRPVALWSQPQGSESVVFAAAVSRSGNQLSLGEPYAVTDTVPGGVGSIAAVPLPADSLLTVIGSSASYALRSCILSIRDGVIAGEFAPGASQAIALEDGGAGESIELLFSGTAELPGIAEGTQILTTGGVQGYAPSDGWINVFPKGFMAPMLKAYQTEYRGTGTYGEDSPNVLIFPFRPFMVVISIKQSTHGHLQASTLATVFFNPMATASVPNPELFQVLSLQISGSSGDEVRTGQYANFRDRTLTWYGGTVNLQMNDVNNIYSVIAYGI